MAHSVTKPHSLTSSLKQRRQCHFSEVAKPGAKVCAAFNTGQCVDGTACLYIVNRLCHTTELFCKRKGYSKNGVGVFKAVHTQTQWIRRVGMVLLHML